MEDTQHWYKSTTIRNGLMSLLMTLVSIAALLGIQLDVEPLKEFVLQGWALIPSAIAAWNAIRVIIGRVRAEKLIGS